MTDSPKRSHADTSDVELETRQLTLEDWADAKGIPSNGTGETQPSRSGTRVPARPATAKASDRAEDSEAASGDERSRKRPAATTLLDKPEALLTRTDLRELGLERRAVDAVFRVLPVVVIPGYARPLVRVGDYRELVEQNTFRDDRVRPGKRAA
jgi:hypothetical protein